MVLLDIKGENNANKNIDLNCIDTFANISENFTMASNTYSSLHTIDLTHSSISNSTIMYANARSLRSKLDELKMNICTLSEFKMEPILICVSENS